MPANTTPIFTLTPFAKSARIATANANRDGTGTVADLVTGGTNGSRVDRVQIKASVTTTAGMIRFYVTDTAGANPRLVKEIPVTAITASGTVASFDYDWVRGDGLPLVVLASGQKLQVSTNNAEQHDVVAFGGDF